MRVVIPEPIEAFFQVINQLGFIGTNVFTCIFVDITRFMGCALHFTGAAMTHLLKGGQYGAHVVATGISQQAGQRPPPDGALRHGQHRRQSVHGHDGSGQAPVLRMHWHA